MDREEELGEDLNDVHHPLHVKLSNIYHITMHLKGDSALEAKYFIVTLQSIMHAQHLLH